MTKNKPRICAVGVFLNEYDIQLQTLLNLFSKNNIQYIKTTYYKNKVLKFIDIFSFLFINRKKYDVIHIQAHSGYNIISVIISIFWAKILNKKIIVMYYGGDAKSYFSNHPYFYKLVFSRIDVVVVACNYMKSIFSDILKIDTKIIPHIINIEEWPNRLRSKSKGNLLWVRSFWDDYNPLMLLKVYKKIININPDFKLKIIGAGYLEKEIKNFININELNGIELLGRVSDSDLKSSYEWADVFINTTNIDNQPVTVLEAMTCGCAIVSTNPGGIPDIIEDGYNGLLCNTNDIDSMVDNVMSLHNDFELFCKLSKNGRLYINKHFSKKIIYERWQKRYNSLSFKI